MKKIEKTHAKKVLLISEQVKAFHALKKKVRIYHGSTNSTRTQNFKKNEVIYISDLNHVLEVNAKKGYVLVEPNVPMDKLVKETLQHNMIPPVIMEFPGITVGGAIQGGAGESSSFKWGGFHSACLEYEIVLGNGEVLTVSATKNPDLYWGTACSYGSLGIITKIKLKIIPAKSFVELTYNRVESFSETIEKMGSKTKGKIDFIDAILFTKTKGTIMTGVFSNKSNLPVSCFSKASDDWFYTHAESVTDKYETWKELIPLEDYLFRYNRGAFWVGKYAFLKLHLPFNRVTRFLMNPLMKTRTLYRFLQAINISQRQIVQDLCLPQNTTLSFLEFIDTKIQIYPLWLLPGKFGEKHDRLSPGYGISGLAIDVGVWGKVYGNHSRLMKLNRELEKTLQKLKGRKVLYAHQYYTQKEFWKIYDLTWYTKLRNKYHATDTFPDVYEKTYVSEKYDFSVLKGLMNVIKSPFNIPLS